MCESLKSNTTLSLLYLNGEGNKNINGISAQFHFAFRFKNVFTGNGIGATEAISLSEALKSNTTLTELNLSGKDNRKNAR